MMRIVLGEVFILFFGNLFGSFFCLLLAVLYKKNEICDSRLKRFFIISTPNETVNLAFRYAWFVMKKGDGNF